MIAPCAWAGLRAPWKAAVWVPLSPRVRTVFSLKVSPEYLAEHQGSNSGGVLWVMPKMDLVTRFLEQVSSPTSMVSLHLQSVTSPICQQLRNGAYADKTQNLGLEGGSLSPL